MNEKELIYQISATVLTDIAGIRAELHHISSMLNLEMFVKYQDNALVTDNIIDIINSTMRTLQKIDSAYDFSDDDDNKQEKDSASETEKRSYSSIKKPEGLSCLL